MAYCMLQVNSMLHHQRVRKHSVVMLHESRVRVKHGSIDVVPLPFLERVGHCENGEVGKVELIACGFALSASSLEVAHACVEYSAHRHRTGRRRGVAPAGPANGAWCPWRMRRVPPSSPPHLAVAEPCG